MVQKALEYLTNGRTVLTIAHRLSTIRNANKILVLDNGKICEEGTYEDLVYRDKGAFKTLVGNQMFDNLAPETIDTTDEKKSASDPEVRLNPM